jgi:hypothetical protein
VPVERPSAPAPRLAQMDEPIRPSGQGLGPSQPQQDLGASLGIDLLQHPRQEPGGDLWRAAASSVVGGPGERADGPRPTDRCRQHQLRGNAAGSLAGAVQSARREGMLEQTPGAGMSSYRTVRISGCTRSGREPSSRIPARTSSDAARIVASRPSSATSAVTPGLAGPRIAIALATPAASRDSPPSRNRTVVATARGEISRAAPRCERWPQAFGGQRFGHPLDDRRHRQRRWSQNSRSRLGDQAADCARVRSVATTRRPEASPDGWQGGERTPLKAHRPTERRRPRPRPASRAPG